LSFEFQFELTCVFIGERGAAQLCEGVPGDGISDERDGPPDDVSGEMMIDEGAIGVKKK
jgi:hypothetical protein